MQDYYFNGNTAIINYTKKYMTNPVDLLDSEGFSEFLDRFLAYLKHHNQVLYIWLTDDAKLSDVKVELIKLMKLLLVLEPAQIHHPALNQPVEFLEVIEEAYQFWRRTQRYSIMYTQNKAGYQLQNFIDADTEFNAMVLDFYRTVQQKVQGSRNKVYRQLQAGTNASLLLQDYSWSIPDGYEALFKIPFVNEIMLRTPLILHPSSSKRTGTFTEVEENPMKEFVRGSDDDWICFPAKVGSLLMLAYFHRNYISSAVAVPNLFEMASQDEVENRKPNAVMIFGNPDGREDTVFWHDKANDIWVGKISAAPIIEYFGYTKKMMLTLHNLAMIQKGWLPIHGAMVDIYLHDGTKKGIMFMGDSGAGKSETIEALTGIASELIDHQVTVFDDMGSIHLDESGKVRAHGTEIGAFVRLDDLDKGTAYKDMDRSIFFNPEKANARVVIPAAPYEEIIQDHKIDCFMYANNYTDKRGMHLFASKEEAEPVFIEGKRFALGTTQEKGLSTTFFANPFGPMQKQGQCRALIDKMFDALFAQKIPVGEIYTCLGLPDKGNNGIQDAAKALLEFVKK